MVSFLVLSSSLIYPGLETKEGLQSGTINRHRQRFLRKVCPLHPNTGKEDAQQRPSEELTPPASQHRAGYPILPAVVTARSPWPSQTPLLKQGSSLQTHTHRDDINFYIPSDINRFRSTAHLHRGWARDARQPREACSTHIYVVGSRG